MRGAYSGRQGRPRAFQQPGIAGSPAATTTTRGGHLSEVNTQFGPNVSYSVDGKALVRSRKVLYRTAVKSEIETFTENKWDIPPYPDMDPLLRNYDGLSAPLPTPVYTYMLYLRHHGFPSPLLDWTRSPYVAAYYAFRYPSKPPGGRVSIYAFSETPEGFKSRGSDRPRIIRLGPYIRSHRRHFLQQSDYSICLFFENMWRFAPHQEVFSLDDPHQDILTKIDIPITERLKVLKSLDDFNLNAFSMFGSEESLLETMAFRALEPRGT